MSTFVRFSGFFQGVKINCQREENRPSVLEIDFLCLKIDFQAPVLRLKNQTKDFFTFWLKFWSNWLHPQEVYCYGKKSERGETECWVRLRLALCRG